MIPKKWVFSSRLCSLVCLTAVALALTAGCGGGGGTTVNSVPSTNNSAGNTDISRVVHIEVKDAPTATTTVIIRTRSVATVVAEANSTATATPSPSPNPPTSGLSEGAGSRSLPITQGNASFDLPMRGQPGQQVRIEATAVTAINDQSNVLGFAYADLTLGDAVAPTIVLTPK